MYDHNHDCPFEAFITNLGKYNEGDLVGEWVKFPVSDDEIKKVFSRIGIGSHDEFGQPYEEWFITDYDVYVPGIYGYLGEFTSIETLNKLAQAIDDLDEHDYKKFNALCEAEDIASADDILNLINDLESYMFYPDIKNHFDYGYDLVYVQNIYDSYKDTDLFNYIDFEKLGREKSLDGTFTNYGYIERY